LKAPEYDDLDDGSPQRISRTKKKEAALAAQRLGERLLSLTDDQLSHLKIPEMLKEALADARSMKKHGALRRQLQYIGTLMRHLDTDQLQEQLDGIARQGHEAARRFKQTEQWRDRLIAGDDDQAATLVAQYPQMDQSLLADLVQKCRQATIPNERKKAGRALFRYIQQFIN